MPLNVKIFNSESSLNHINRYSCLQSLNCKYSVDDFLKSLKQRTSIPAFITSAEPYSSSNNEIRFFGSLENGMKCLIQLIGIKYFIDVSSSNLLPWSNITTEKQQSIYIILSNFCSGNNLTFEIIKRRWFNGYTENDIDFFRIYFDSAYERKEMLTYLKEFENESFKEKNNLYRELLESYHKRTLIFANDEVDLDLFIARNINIDYGNWNILTLNSEYSENVKVVDNLVILLVNNIDRWDKNNLIISNYIPDESIFIENTQKKLLVAYWDIETYDEDPEHIPTPDRKTSFVFMIAVSLAWTSHSKPFKRICLVNSWGWTESEINTLSSHISDKNKEDGNFDFELILVNGNESLLLDAFVTLISNIKPDIISGFNDLNYDWNFIYKRLNLQQYYKLFISKNICIGDSKKFNISKKPELTNKIVKISGEDNMNINWFSSYGFIPMDTMVIMRKTYPDDKKYKLNHFLNKLGLSLKEDMPPRKMHDTVEFILQKKLNNDIIKLYGDIITYCCRDAEACLDLWNKINVFQEICETCSLVHVDSKVTIYRANGCKVLNTIAKYGEEFGIALSIQTSGNKTFPKDMKIPGAYVQKPKFLGPNKLPCAALDFKSLYPSIIITFNLSPEKVISHFDFIERENKNVIEQTFRKQYYKKIKDTKLTYEISVPNENKNYDGYSVLDSEGLFPKILRSIFKKRTEVKKKLEDPNIDNSVKITMNAKQKALKILMNTFYGKAAEKSSPLFNIIVAGGITTTGVRLIKKCREKVESQLGLVANYIDTDSLYLTLNDNSYNTILSKLPETISREELYKILIVETTRYVLKAKDILNKDLLEEAKVIEFVGNPPVKKVISHLELAYEHTYFPIFFMSKKKYCGQPHHEILDPSQISLDINFKDMVIKGIDFIKFGCAELLEEICKIIITNIFDINNTKQTDQIVYDVLRHFYIKQTTGDLDLKLFKKEAKYNKSKNNIAINKFVEYVQEKYPNEKINNLEVFAFVYIKPKTESINITGTAYHTSRGEQMQLYSKFDKNNDIIDLSTYLENQTKTLARFLAYMYKDKNEEANNLDDDNDDDDECLKKASKKIKEKIISLDLELLTPKSLIDKETVKSFYKYKLKPDIVQKLNKHIDIPITKMTKEKLLDLIRNLDTALFNICKKNNSSKLNLPNNVLLAIKTDFFDFKDSFIVEWQNFDQDFVFSVDNFIKITHSKKSYISLKDIVQNESDRNVIINETISSIKTLSYKVVKLILLSAIINKTKL